MILIPGFLALLLPIPAVRDTQRLADARRRRAVASLRLAPHLLRDVGLDDAVEGIEDGRWVRRFDLDR